MPRGRQQKPVAKNNIIQVTPKNARKSKNAKVVQKTPASVRQSSVRKSARKSSSVLSRERKPWEVDSDEEDKPVYSRGGYFSNSDMDSEFEDETIKEEMEDDISGSEIGDAFSMDVYSSEDISCPWKEMPPDQLPSLDLPCSSLDLLVDKDFLFDTLEVYEFLRTYYHVIQISPFLFEDFCCALRASVQSKLLCEIHIAFIRILFRDDEDEQTIYSVQDTNNSFNVMFQLLEPMTFAEILRQYVESDTRFSSEILEILQNTNYPFVELEKRLVVLKWLCDRFMETSTFKRVIKNEGKIFYEEHCRDCGKAGDVLLCDGCEAIYHLNCANLQEVPSGKWLCKICELHQVKGVTTGLQTGQKEGRFNRRVESLGFDRHGRIYWFLARRIFIQNLENKEIYYFSSLPQLYELLNLMDPYYYEKRLFRVLIDLMPVIAEQMQITVQLTDERRKNLQNKTQRESPQPYLHVDNIHRMAKIVSESLFFEKEIKEEPITETTGIITKREGIDKVRSLLHIQDGHLTDTFWSGGVNGDIRRQSWTKKMSHLCSIHNSGESVQIFLEGQLIGYYNRLENELALANSSGTMDGLFFLEDIQERTQKGYRLGFSDAEYRDYINQYSVNDYAKSPYQRAKERDRRKYMCSRFSLMDEGEFNWTILKNKDCYMSDTEIGRIIQLSLRKLIEKLPDELMHRLWQGNEKYRYLQTLQQSTSASELKQLLLQFEKALRKPAFANVWWNSLGHTKLIRVTSEDRERRQKLDLMKKKEERSLIVADINEDSDIVWVKYTRYNGPPKHNIWRLKDEQFRVNGRDGLGGWIWVSSTLARKFLPLAKIPPLNISYCSSQKLLKTREALKASRLDKIIKCFSTWRTINERILLAKKNLHPCYSDSCRLISSGNSSALKALSVTTNGEFLPCYSPSCVARESRAYASSTFDVVKAFKPFRLNPYNLRALKEQKTPENTLGEGRPFPLKKPFDYRSKSGKRSLLVLPKDSLRKLARQGGLNAATIVPGFHRTSKSNTNVWNYPCQRPLFDSCWRYMVCKTNSLHSVALQFRIMYACIRWADMDPNSDDEDTRVWAHHPDYDEVRMVIGHRENPPDGYYEQYKLRIEQFSIDESAISNNLEDDSEDYRVPSARPKSTRKRKKNQTEQKFKHKRTGVFERWSDGVDLKLYEIRDYWKKYFFSHAPPVVRREPTAPMAQTPQTSSGGSARTTPLLNGSSSSSKRTQMKQFSQQMTSFSAAPKIRPQQPIQSSAIKQTPSSNHFIADSRRRFTQAINFNNEPPAREPNTYVIRYKSINEQAMRSPMQNNLQNSWNRQPQQIQRQQLGTPSLPPNPHLQHQRLMPYNQNASGSPYRNRQRHVIDPRHRFTQVINMPEENLNYGGSGTSNNSVLREPPNNFIISYKPINEKPSANLNVAHMNRNSSPNVPQSGGFRVVKFN